MKLDDLDECIITEEEIWEMARVAPRDSGLPCIMFASSKDSVNGKHGPRIKVSNVPGTFSANDNFVVSIANPPALVAGTSRYSQSSTSDILDWVAINTVPLLKLWNNQYTSDIDFYAELRKL